MDEQKLKEIQSRKLTTDEQAKKHTEKEYRVAEIDTRMINVEARTAEFAFAAGALVVRWYGIEKLRMAPDAIRLERWQHEPPFLMNHDCEDQRGVILNGRLESGILRGTVKFSRTDDGEELFMDVQDGIRKKTSIGYITHDERTLSPEEMTEEEKQMALEYNLPVIEATEWEPIEGSSVWQNADMGAELGRSLDKRLPVRAEQTIHNTIHKEERTVEPITQEQLDAKVKAERETAAAEVETRMKAERESETARVAEIMNAADSFKAEVPDALARAAKAAADRNISVPQFYKELREARKPEAPVTALQPNGGRDENHIKLDEFVKPWERRAVKYLNAIVCRKMGKTDKADALETELRAELKSMTEVARDAEVVECVRMIKDSGLPVGQQKRIFSSLDISGMNKRTANVGTTTAGGFLVPTPLLTEIFLLVEKWGAARRHFRIVNMTGPGNALKLDTLVTEAIAYWTDEAANITASDLVFGQGSLTLKKLAGVSGWTSELDEDAAIAYLPIWIASIARQIKKKEDLAGFIGDGTSTYGSFTGMLPASTNLVTLDAGKTSVNDATADDYRALRDAVNIDWREGSEWFLPPASVSNLEGMKDAQGNYIYRPPAAGLPALLWGYPIADGVGLNVLAQTDAVSLRFAAFGDPKHMLMGVKRDVTIQVSNEAVLQAGDGSISFNAFQADGQLVKATERVGFKLVLTTAIAVLRTAAA